MSRPFLWGWAAAAIVCFILLLRISARRARALVLIIFGVTCAMFLAEAAAFTYDARRSANGAITSEYSPKSLTRLDRDLGWTLNPGARISATRKWSDSTLFRVTYSITDSGVRRTRGNPLGDTWLFIGCSLTFGEGVEDDETLPARFSEQLDWKANVVNVSATGWGPHHMLRVLETGRLGGVGPPVKHVVYQAVPNHVMRAAGRAPWDIDGPSYKISGDSIRFAGRFHGRAGVRALTILRRSDLWRLFERRYQAMPPSDAELDLYARIVERAAALAEKKLSARFTILFWDDDGNRATKRTFDRLVSTGLPVIRTTSFLTRRELDSLRLPHDNHPAPEAYRRLAAGLAAHLTDRSPTPAGR